MDHSLEPVLLVYPFSFRCSESRDKTTGFRFARFFHIPIACKARLDHLWGRSLGRATVEWWVRGVLDVQLNFLCDHIAPKHRSDFERPIKACSDAIRTDVVPVHDNTRLGWDRPVIVK